MDPYLLISVSYADMISYGIAYAEYDDNRPVLIESYPDLSLRRSRVEKLVAYCNAARLSPSGLRSVVEQFLDTL